VEATGRARAGSPEGHRRDLAGADGDPGADRLPVVAQLSLPSEYWVSAPGRAAWATAGSASTSRHAARAHSGHRSHPATGILPIHPFPA
jgi:hypothetical protein